MAHISSDVKVKRIIQSVYQRALNASELNLDLFVNDNLEQAVADLAHLSPNPLKSTREQKFFEKTLKDLPKFEEFKKKILYNHFPGNIKLETRTRELISFGLFEDALYQYSIAPNKQCKKIPSDLFSYFIKNIINSKCVDDKILFAINRLVLHVENIPLDVLPSLITNFLAQKWPKCKNKLLEEFKKNAEHLSPTDLCRVFTASSIASQSKGKIPSIYMPYLKYSIYLHYLKNNHLNFSNETGDIDPFIAICLEIMPNGPELGTVKLPILRQTFLYNKFKGNFIHGLANTIVKSKVKPDEASFEQYIDQIKLVIEANCPRNIIIGLLDLMLEYIKYNRKNQLIILASQILWSYSPGKNLIIDSLDELSENEFTILLGNVVKNDFYIDKPNDESVQIIVNKFNKIILGCDIDYLGEEIAKALLFFKFNNTIGDWDVRWNCIIENIIDKISNLETRNIISYITKIGFVDYLNNCDDKSEVIDLRFSNYNMYRKILLAEMYADNVLNNNQNFVKIPEKTDITWGKCSFFYKYPEYVPLAVTCESVLQSIDNDQYNLDDISKIIQLESAVVDYPRLLLLMGRRLIKIDGMDLLGERILEHLPSFDLYQTCAIAWSLSTLDYLPIELVTCLMSSINIKLETMELETLSGSRLACFLSYACCRNPFLFFNQISPFQKVLSSVGFRNKVGQNNYHYKDSILSISNQDLLSKIAFEHSNFFDDPLKEFAPFYYDGASERLKMVLSYHFLNQNDWKQIGSKLSTNQFKLEQLLDHASPGGRLMQENYAISRGYKVLKINNNINLDKLFRDNNIPNRI